MLQVLLKSLLINVHLDNSLFTKISIVWVQLLKIKYIHGLVMRKSLSIVIGTSTTSQLLFMVIYTVELYW